MEEKTFKYQIELTQPKEPRFIAEAMTTMRGVFARSLLSVTDLQRNDYYYGDTYVVGNEQEKIVEPRASYEWALELYAAHYEDAEGTPGKDAYAWILQLLKQEWVPGNIGLLVTYLREFSMVLRHFEAYCEMMMWEFAEQEEGEFAEQEESEE